MAGTCHGGRRLRQRNRTKRSPKLRHGAERANYVPRVATLLTPCCRTPTTGLRTSTPGPARPCSRTRCPWPSGWPLGRPRPTPSHMPPPTGAVSILVSGGSVICMHDAGRDRAQSRNDQPRRFPRCRNTLSTCPTNSAAGTPSAPEIFSMANKVGCDKPRSILEKCERSMSADAASASCEVPSSSRALRTI